jgi:phosphatidate cytidylyltransferase
MKTRAITGFFFVAVMLAAVYFGAYSFSLMFLLLSLLCLYEFFELLKNSISYPLRWISYVMAACIYLPLAGYFVAGWPIHAVFFAVLPAMVLFISELYRKKKDPLINISVSFLGVIYTVLPFCFFLAIAFLDGEYNYRYPLAFFVLLWLNDTGAYLFGISFGKHRLFERHSPKKSWEGFFGGLICSVLAAILIGWYFSELEAWQWVAVSLLIVLGATFGDLSESMFKRSVDIKDSGKILPGHGGFLDRFDGLLLAAPLVYIFLMWVKQSG